MKHQEIVDAHQPGKEPAGEKRASQMRRVVAGSGPIGLESRDPSRKPENDAEIGDQPEIFRLPGNRVGVAYEVVVVDAKKPVGDDDRRQQHDAGADDEEGVVEITLYSPLPWQGFGRGDAFDIHLDPPQQMPQHATADGQLPL